MPGGDTTPEEAAAPSCAGYNPGLLLFRAQKAQGACVTSTEGAWPRRASALYGGRKMRCGESGAGPDPRSNSAEVSSSQPALASKSQSKWGPTSNNPRGALTTTEFEMAGNRSQNIKHKQTALIAIPMSSQTPRMLGRPRNQGQLYPQP
uniref:Putative uncharacterized protein DNAJC9-AS1 n=1 Tax=Homo sapiens TaxID=9606 RepID=DAS1_HUMAN|nr:RecName: Full=Putative uncharacterized protein DNAJC9-AS1; AltName: Full=DNAJC9 antisense RNA 1; AltName: Full=DNAJC9 antisense gene protein 1 [Homo sapiens]